MDQRVEKYFELKQQQKEIEKQLKELKEEITAYCEQQQAARLDIGAYTVKLVSQARREYDDAKLYEALPDLDLWRMLSRADPSKITSLIRLQVIPEERIKDTFELKQIKLLQVDKK